MLFNLKPCSHTGIHISQTVKLISLYVNAPEMITLIIFKSAIIEIYDCQTWVLRKIIFSK